MKNWTKTIWLAGIALIVLVFSFLYRGSEPSTSYWSNIGEESSGTPSDLLRRESLCWSTKFNSFVFIFGNSSKKFANSGPYVAGDKIYIWSDNKNLFYYLLKQDSLVLIQDGLPILDVRLNKKMTPWHSNSFSNELDMRAEVLKIANSAASIDDIKNIEQVFANTTEPNSSADALPTPAIKKGE